MLQLLGVRKSFSGRPVIDIPRLQFDPGIHWVQGANGSGKTTLLRIIAGLIPFEGDVQVDGISLKKDPVACRRKLSWAEAEPVYPSFIRGTELVSLYLDSRKVNEVHAAELATIFGVDHYLDAATGSYSAGMLKRLSLLLAFIGHPSFIMLDEPLATLDTGIAELLPHIMRDYQDRYGVTFIYSSHQAFPEPVFSGGKIWQFAGQTVQLKK